MKIEKLNKGSIFFAPALAAIAMGLAFSTAFAANMPKNCVDEFISLSKKDGFDASGFIGELLPAIAKVKLQMKLPFGKPKDSDKTDIGISVGCLKTFPESPAEIKSLLKDAGLLLLVDAASKGVATALSSDEAKSLKNGAAKLLKECTSVYNPDKKFCYDGEVYDKCDGMKYNPTTHICVGDIANLAKCNGIAYNPLKQRCENGIIETKCGTGWYNSAAQFCHENRVLDLCGGKEHNPANQRCQGNVVETKCGANWYNPATQFCHENKVLDLCGGKWYNPAVQRCQSNVVETKCGADWYNPAEKICDDSSGRIYRTVSIGNQTWMAENLNYNASGSKCYDNNARNCEKCGRLYNWQAARAACPKGWHLPSDAEWESLEKAVGDSLRAGRTLKSKSGWNKNGNGTDGHGFSALPCGRGNAAGVFDNIGDYANFWSTTENGKLNAFGVSLSAEKALIGKSSRYDKTNMNSVRCVQDVEKKVSARPENRVQSKPAQSAPKVDSEEEATGVVVGVLIGIMAVIGTIAFAVII